MPVPMYTTHAFSPVVEGGLVIFHVGGHDKGALTAFDVNTGAGKWSWNGDGPGYGSPIVADFGGVRQVVTITQGKLVGVDVATGALLWERPLVSTNFTNSITPVRLGQSVIVWNNVGPLIALSGRAPAAQWASEPAWEAPDLPNRMSNSVLDGDVMFGLTSRNMGQYYAVDVKTGKTLWSSEGRQAANAALARAGNVVSHSKTTASSSSSGEPHGLDRAAPLQGGGHRNVGAAGNLGQPDLRQGCVDADAVDAQLNTHS